MFTASGESGLSLLNSTLAILWWRYCDAVGVSVFVACRTMQLDHWRLRCQITQIHLKTGRCKAFSWIAQLTCYRCWSVAPSFQLMFSMDSFQNGCARKINPEDTGKSSNRLQKLGQQLWQQGTFGPNHVVGNTPLRNSFKGFSGSDFGFNLLNPSVTILPF